MFLICLTFIICKGINVKILIFIFFSNSNKEMNISFAFRYSVLFRIQTNSSLFRFQTKKQTSPKTVNDLLKRHYYPTKD